MLPPAPVEEPPPPPPALDEELPTLTLSPPSGPPGKKFTATATPPTLCRGLYFDAGPAERVGVTMDTATFIAPTDPAITSVDVSVQCYGGPPAQQTFTIEHPAAEPDLELTPTEGLVGTPVTATVTGCAGDGRLLWDNETVEASGGQFIVPADASVGPHTVTAPCETGEATDEFTVVAPAAAPTLTLDTERGPPDTPFRAIGSDFACGDGGVEIYWEERHLTTVTAGSFDESLKVPPDAQGGQYTVRATCANNPDVTDDAEFSVTGTVVTSATATGAATVALDPARGAPGSNVTVIGAGFLCDNDSQPVQLEFDGRTLPAVSADGTGAFRATFAVPQDATGTTVLRASCADGSITRTASFTVTAGQTTPTTTTPPIPDPPPDDSVAVLIVLLVLAAAVIVAVLVYRWLRRPRPPAPNARVRVEPRTGGPPEVALRERAGQRSHAIRLGVHASSATTTIERGER